MTSIYAGETQDVQFDPETKAFGSKSIQEATVFTFRTLDYFQAQEIMSEADDKAKIRKCLEFGLVSIEGDPDKAKQFLAHPKARLVNPLFDVIWSATWGN